MSVNHFRTGGEGERRTNRVLPRVPRTVKDLLVVVDRLGINDGLLRSAVRTLARRRLVLVRTHLLRLERALVGLEDDVLLGVLVVDVEVVVVRTGEDVPARNRSQEEE